jgi:serine protease Do
MTPTMMWHRVHAVKLILVGALLLGVIGYARGLDQVRETFSRKSDIRKTDPSGVGRWLVIVNHHVTMGELTATTEDAAAAALDGTCAPSDIVLTNVTTGIVVDDKGHVLTQLANLLPSHSNPTIVVQTQDRQEFRARFIGRDGATGLCVLHVPGLQVVPPPMHTLAMPKPRITLRDARLAANSPTTHSSTVRIILPMFQPMSSPATGRRAEEIPSQLVWDEIVTDWLATPSLPKPADGNCGIAFDGQNRLVAIVQPKGKHFHVLPIADVKRVVQRILTAGKSVPHGWLGIEGKTLATFPAKDRARLSVSSVHGVVVTAVVPGSPAEEAGLAPGDVILAANDHPLESRRQLNDIVVSHAAGEILKLLVERGGQQHVCQVTLGSPEDTPVSRSPVADEHLAIGLVTSELTAQLAKFFGVTGGLLVTHVFPDSPAAAAGLRSGDVIVKLDGQPVRQSSDLSAVVLHVLAQKGDAPITVEIVRERQAQQLLLPLPLLPPKL